MSRTTTKVLALMVSSSLAVLGFFITRPASAGTNGQQLQVCQQPSEDYQTMLVQGTNQDGEFSIFSTRIAPGGCGSTARFFWVGDVSVTLLQSGSGLPDRTGRCNVPKEGESLTNCFL